MLLIADALETATWALVAATGLLVVANAIPGISDLLAHLRTRKTAAATLVPDMHILRTRLNGSIETQRTNPDPDDDGLEWVHEDCDDLLEMLAPLIDTAPSEGIKLTNELYICRHLLTQAKYQAMKAGVDPKGDRDRREGALRALRLTVAARTTLEAAEDLVPKRHKTIDGERFWDRFARLSSDRERGADERLQRDRGA